LNAAIKIKTSLSPASLLKTLKNIEKDLGRRKTLRFGPREIDLDILFYSDRVIKTKNLVVPHPRMFEREFVLKPLREII
jgi:2-amino-4-hydroxy-6-hydroxymethyldihydropteridine diphosphokinase